METRKTFEIMKSIISEITEMIDNGYDLDGYKFYKCTDCQTMNLKEDNGEITVGFCDKCGHPLWNKD